MHIFKNAQFTNENVNGTFVYLSYRVLMFMFGVANDILLQSLSKVQAVGIGTLHVLGFYYLVFSFPILRKIQNYWRQANPSDLVQKLVRIGRKNAISCWAIVTSYLQYQKNQWQKMEDIPDLILPPLWKALQRPLSFR